MIEAGIVAVAILVVGIAGIVAYRKELDENRAPAIYVGKVLAEIDRELLGVRTDMNHLAGTVAELSAQIMASNRALAPLCESLAESLTARMSTIDSDMADLRTRVETGPGRRTLKL